MMRKLLLILFLITAIGAKCQISDDFLGLTLGKSTYSECLKQMKKDGYFLEDFEHMFMYIDIKKPYEGVKWDVIAMQFRNKNLFTCVSFSFRGTKEEVDKVIEHLYKTYSERYPAYRKVDDDFFGHSLIPFNDGKMQISIINYGKGPFVDTYSMELVIKYL